MRTVLISGIPASGKSSFGGWLAARHGWIHVDMEHGGLAAIGADAFWNLGLQTGSFGPFVKFLQGCEQSVVCDWGFPVQFSGTIERLHAHGMETWWFDGDDAAARESFLKRGRGSAAAFDKQLAEIRKYWPIFGGHYSGRVVITVTAGPEYLEWARVAAQMKLLQG